MVDLSMQHSVLVDRINDLVREYLESVYAVDLMDTVANNIIVKISSMDTTNGEMFETTYLDGHRGYIADLAGDIIATAECADAVIPSADGNPDFDFIQVG